MTRLVLVSALLACGGTSSSPAAPAAQPTSDFRVGDYVVYDYTGAYAPAPTRLRQEIRRVNGLQIEMEVRAERGEERREWAQVLTDTEENRQNHVIDELYEVSNGTRTPLANENNRDLMRLYGWTLPDCVAPVEQLPTEERAIPIGGETQQCQCARQRMQCGGQPAVFERCECDMFPWGIASGVVMQEGATEPYWRVEIREVGFR
ncbi:MAG: hypothetical protein AAGE52_42090 [Myxococcota bacterium]